MYHLICSQHLAFRKLNSTDTALIGVNLPESISKEEYDSFYQQFIKSDEKVKSILTTSGNHMETLSRKVTAVKGQLVKLEDRFVVLEEKHNTLDQFARGNISKMQGQINTLMEERQRRCSLPENQENYEAENVEQCRIVAAVKIQSVCRRRMAMKRFIAIVTTNYDTILGLRVLVQSFDLDSAFNK